MSTTTVQFKAQKHSKGVNNEFTQEMSNERIIHETRDYDTFHFIKSNRPVSSKHVEEFKVRLKEKNLLPIFPLVVDMEKGILDGQHRFLAAKALNIPINYIFSDEMEISDIADVNSTGKKWVLSDYLDHFVKLGFKDYEFLKKFVEQENINPYAAIGLLNGTTAQPGSKLIKEFERGGFAVKDLPHAKKVMGMVNDFRPLAPTFYKNRMFMNAISRVAQHPDYDHEEMMKKLEYMTSKLRKHPDVASYVNMLEEIYNFKSRNKVRFSD